MKTESTGVDESNEALTAVPLTTFEARLIWNDDSEGNRVNTSMVAFYDQAQFAGNRPGRKHRIERDRSRPIHRTAGIAIDSTASETRHT